MEPKMEKETHMFRRPPTNIGGRLLRMAQAGVLATLTSMPLMASTWYVDNADPACTNAGPGDAQKPFCAIQTAAKRARAGDKVLVSPGDYREQVTLRYSGTPASPIVFQATGPRTTVLGSLDISRPDRWRRASSNTWRHPLDVAPRQVFVDGVRLAEAPDDDEITTNSFYFDAGSRLLYVDIGGPNPAVDHLVEAGSRTYGFNVAGSSNIVIEGFELRHQNSACVRAFQATDIVLKELSTEFAGTYGIRIDSCTGPVTVKDCRISSSISNGILVAASTGVTVKDNRSHHNGFHGISIQSSSNNVIEGNVSYSNFRWNVRSATGIDLSNNSRFNTVVANIAYRNQDSGFQAYSGSDQNLLARNVSWGNGDHGFDTNDSTGTRYVNNTSVLNHSDGFSIEGGSKNTTLANNISVDNGLTTAHFEIFVDSESASGFSSDFNILRKSGAGRVVRMNGSSFTTIEEFREATPNEQQGLGADPDFVNASPESRVLNLRLNAGSWAIDSANSGASGFVSADCNGFSPTDDPETSNIGAGRIAFADRGAFEFDPPPTADLSVSPSSGEIDLVVTADASGSTDNDDTPIESYSFDFGDGTVIGPQPRATATHTYTTPGTFTIVITVTDEGGKSTTDTAQVTVQDHAPGARLSVTPAEGILDLPVVADASASRGSSFTPIVSYTFDFGDGTVIGPQTSSTATHLYSTAGNFTILATVTDAAGQSSVATASVRAVLNSAPLASMTASPVIGRKPLAVILDASGSTDTDPAPIASYTFNFGDGTVVGPQASPTATHLYRKKGKYLVSVTVTDTAGLSSTATKLVTVKKKGSRR